MIILNFVKNLHDNRESQISMLHPKIVWKSYLIVLPTSLPKAGFTLRAPYVRNRNAQTSLRRYARLYSTRRSRCVHADIYAISVAYHFREMDLFYMSRKSLHIRIGCGLLANDNPASTRKRWRIVGVSILGTCAIPTA